ncbi:fungal-specific transcription factor domain-containing protein [Exophiala viscosa]|uniref:fungal-specific transcription factor domain-containing protein n=1 Tax=Exophiala viscosa TaxID=2486360 RepID=UPI0021955E93|nr:fungal-specific transcription factor domain-containing protein [Exophiala viscosa]
MNDVTVELSTAPVPPGKRSVATFSRTMPFGAFEWDESDEISGLDGSPNTSELHESGSGYLGNVSSAAFLHVAGISFASLEILPSSPTSIGEISAGMERLDTYINAYFSVFHTSYPILHEATFRAQQVEIIARPPQVLWQSLTYIVAAIGATATASDRTLHQSYFKTAKLALTINILECGNMTTVQVLALFAQYLQKSGNKPNQAYNFIGLARRIALSLGLHREVPDSSNINTNAWKIENRRRVWWCRFVLDFEMSLTLSRPIELLQGADVQIPLNILDETLTMTATQMPEEVLETTIYTGLICQAQFNVAIADIYNCLLDEDNPAAEQVIAADDEMIRGWSASLPPFFAEHMPQDPKFVLSHSILHLRPWNFRIVMYRPSLIQAMEAASTSLASPPSKALDAIFSAACRCQEAAKETISKVDAVMPYLPKTQLASWYMLWFLFQAAVIAALSLRDCQDAAEAEQWRNQVDCTVRLMRTIECLVSKAARCVQIVENVVLSRSAQPIDLDLGEIPSADFDADFNEMGIMFNSSLPDQFGHTDLID